MSMDQKSFDKAVMKGPVQMACAITTSHSLHSQICPFKPNRCQCDPTIVCSTTVSVNGQLCEYHSRMLHADTAQEYEVDPNNYCYRPMQTEKVVRSGSESMRKEDLSGRRVLSNESRFAHLPEGTSSYQVRNGNGYRTIAAKPLEQVFDEYDRLVNKAQASQGMTEEELHKRAKEVIGDERWSNVRREIDGHVPPEDDEDNLYALCTGKFEEGIDSVFTLNSPNIDRARNYRGPCLVDGEAFANLTQPHRKPTIRVRVSGTKGGRCIKRSEIFEKDNSLSVSVKSVESGLVYVSNYMCYLRAFFYQ